MEAIQLTPAKTQVLEEMQRLRKYYAGLTPDELAYIALLKIVNEHGSGRMVKSF